MRPCFPELRLARAALAVALLALLPSSARAHQQRLSYGDYHIRGARVEVRLKLAAADVGAVVRLDHDGDGRITQADLDALGGAPALALLSELKLASDGQACALAPPAPLRLDREDASSPAPGAAGPSDGLLLTGAWTCPRPPGTLTVRAGLVDLFPAGHTHLAHLTFEGPRGARQTERVAQAGQASFTVEPFAEGHAFARFFELGLEHIFTGADHLAFLLALLLLGGSLGSLVKIVTSFTVAHSLTLALAALDLFVPPPRLIEPLIALSIVAVAVENLTVLRAHEAGAVASALRHRWLLTLGFGLVHGFGFASALRDLSLDRSELVTALVAFNVGVETGQIALVAGALPLLALLRRWRPFAARGAQAISVAVGLAGAVWVVERLRGA